MLNRSKFFESYHIKFGSLNSSQVQGINFLLEKLDLSTVFSDARHYAYILATIYHECAAKWQPVTEYGSHRYLSSKRYWPYIGRGYVQLTWDWNYKKFSALLNLPLFDNPDLALEPETAWKILELGMSEGLYTGKKLSNYFNETKTDWVNARRIINGLDCANLIAGYARDFYDIIEFDNTVKLTAANETLADAHAALNEKQEYEGRLAEAQSA
jgi:hypothetical protein